MILTEQQTINLLAGNSEYDCKLINRKFGYDVFRDSVSPVANIICFQSPIRVGELGFTRAVIVCGELLNYDLLAGICFYRLYLAQVGTILAEKLNKECLINENVLLIDQKQACISIINKRKDTVLFHLIIPDVLKDGEQSKSFHQLDLSFEDTVDFKEKLVDSFYYLTRSVFIESQRDNHF